MKTQISQFPESGTAAYAELCRRQDVLTRGLAGEREALFREGVGREYVPDLPTPVARPRYTAAGELIVEPSITVFSPPRLVKRPWYRRLF